MCVTPLLKAPLAKLVAGQGADIEHGKGCESRPNAGWHKPIRTIELIDQPNDDWDWQKQDAKGANIGYGYLQVFDGIRASAHWGWWIQVGWCRRSHLAWLPQDAAGEASPW